MCTTACYRALELDVSGIDSDACAKKCGTVLPAVCGTRTSAGPIVTKQRGGKSGFRAVRVILLPTEQLQALLQSRSIEC